MDFNEKLLFGLPCIRINDSHYVFSPYKKKVAKVDISDLKKLEQILTEKEYLGNASPYGPTYQSRTGQLTIVVTKACQLRCLYCNVNAGDENKNIDLDTAYKAIDLFLDRTKYKKNVITFFGGEPTIKWKKIDNIINYAKNKAAKKNKELKFSLSTNGIINDNQIEFLKKNNFSVIISLDGIKEVHDIQRPLVGNKSSYNIICNNIVKLKEKQIIFKVSAVVTEYSVKYLLPFVEEMIKLGVKQIQLDPVSHAGKALEDPNKFKIRPDYKIYLKEYFKAVEYGEKYGVTIFNHISGRLFKPANYFCDLIASDAGFLVSYNGLLSQCIEVQDNEHECFETLVVGRINNNIISIDDEKIAKVRKETLVENTECNECFARYFCAGGCAIRNFHNNNRFNETDSYYCNIAKETTKWFIKKFISKVGVNDESYGN